MIQQSTYTFDILHELLEDRYRRYNVPAYIDDDPILLPHLFTNKEDVEIAAFLTASIAWGQRKTIIKNARELMRRMDDSPADFVLNAESSDLAVVDRFVHRTFQATDCRFFIRALQDIYRQRGGLEEVFTKGYSESNTVYDALRYFREVFLSTPHEPRSEKHLSAVAANSAAKRLNMFLRWMVRKDEVGVDFGLWQGIPASALMIPLDVHVGKVGRALGLLDRRQDDWKAVEEITGQLRRFDTTDPAKYDFALFGMGLSGELTQP